LVAYPLAADVARLEQYQLIQQALCALAQDVDPAPDCRHALAGMVGLV
jgi:hypothetical protein